MWSPSTNICMLVTAYALITVQVQGFQQIKVHTSMQKVTWTIPKINGFVLPSLSSSSLESLSMQNDDIDDTRPATHPILNHPAISALSIDSRPRSRLQPKHKYLFQNKYNKKYDVDKRYDDTDKYSDDDGNDDADIKGDDKNSMTVIDSRLRLFDELASVVCDTGAVCRKELFETFAAAYQINIKFPDVKRVADLAAGHGLLSWFLLALDHYGCDCNTDNQKNNNQERRPRTAICVDRRMPPSADKIASAMIRRFPELEMRWSYVQSDLSSVEPHSSCLLTSVHACGTLSDYLIELAIGGSNTGKTDVDKEEYHHMYSSPLAIVPCCHTASVRKGYRPHFLSGIRKEEVVAMVEERKNARIGGNYEAVADVVDEVRCQTLRNAGYNVEEVLLPDMFTARNRLMLGEPTSSIPSGARPSPASHNFFQRKPPSAIPDIHIPLSDDEESISYCHSISGRKHATKRLMQQLPNHYSMTQVISIWLTDYQDDESRYHSSLTEKELQEIANQCCQDANDRDEIQCEVEAFPSLDTQASTGRHSRRYKFTYRKRQGTEIRKAAVPRSSAKKIHGIIRGRLIDNFGDLVR